MRVCVGRGHSLYATLAASVKKQMLLHLFQEGKHAMKRMLKVLNDGGSSANETLPTDLNQKGERSTNDPATCLHYTL